MSLLSLLMIICAWGVLLYLVNSYVPMDGKIKNIFNIVVVIVLLIWLLKVFGLWAYLSKLNL